MISSSRVIFVWTKTTILFLVTSLYVKAFNANIISHTQQHIRIRKYRDRLCRPVPLPTQTSIQPNNAPALSYSFNDFVDQTASYLSEKVYPYNETNAITTQQSSSDDETDIPFSTPSNDVIIPSSSPLPPATSTYNALSSQIQTAQRVALPALMISLAFAVTYPSISLFVTGLIGEGDEAFYVLNQDAAQYVQDILINSGLTFVILVGYTYYFLYQQQEQIFLALFDEVSEAKSLLEQVSLTCTGRSMYPKVLQYISTYVTSDLKRLASGATPSPNNNDGNAASQSSRIYAPAEALSRRPMDDPLEAILYLTSVGTPGVVYDTVKSLRDARSKRLGALQRKMPALQLNLLKVLAGLLLPLFYVCGSGSENAAGSFRVLESQSYYYGIMVFGIALVLGLITELWSYSGGAYDVDGVLTVMVRGLESELEARLSKEMERVDDSAKVDNVPTFGLENSASNNQAIYSKDLQSEGDEISPKSKRRKKWLFWRRK